MTDASFSQHLFQKLSTAQDELLCLYEQLETMRSIDGPRLQQTYEKVIGPFEEAALLDELERLLLERKLELIQRKINRREPIDLAAIDAELQTTRRELLEKLAQQRPETTAPALSKEDEQALKEAFRFITARFLPALHPELTERQKALYEKALAAYRRQDLPALLLVKEMLMQEDLGGGTFSITLDLEVSDASGELPEDHTLAEKLLPYFIPTKEEAQFQNELAQTDSQISAAQQEIDELWQQFPFQTKAMLDDPLRTAAYQGELQRRQSVAQEQCRMLNQQIDELLKGKLT